MHEKAREGSNGARCLDGSAGAFYFAPSAARVAQRAAQRRRRWLRGGAADGAPAVGLYSAAREKSVASPAAVEQEDDWIIYMRHGGWCYDPAGCLSRSRTCLGTTDGLASVSASPGLEVQCPGAGERPKGILSDDCAINPGFCNANVVYVWYCDGTSMLSEREAPVVVAGQTLYYRGRRIIDSVLETLAEDDATLTAAPGAAAGAEGLFPFRFRDARRVLLVGTSAGGVGAFAHADRVGAWLRAAPLPRLVAYKASSLSGFFPAHMPLELRLKEKENNENDGQNFPAQMKALVESANATGALPLRCVAATVPANQWRCIFPERSVETLRTPFFIEQVRILQLPSPPPASPSSSSPLSLSLFLSFSLSFSFAFAFLFHPPPHLVTPPPPPSSAVRSR